MKFQCEKCNGIIAIDNEPGTEVKCGHCKENITAPQLFTASHVIGDFIITKVLSENTYECKQISLDISVTLKTLQTEDNDAVLEFIRGARAKAKLKDVHTIGQDGNIYFAASML